MPVSINLLSDAWWHLLAVAVAIVAGSAVAHRLIWPIVWRMASRSVITEAVARRCKRAASWGVPIVAIQIALQGMPQDEPGLAFVEHLNGVMVILMLTWLAVSAVQGVAEGVIQLHPAEVSDNLTARRIQTQTRVLARIASGAVLVAGLAFVLMTFPRARQLGTSVLASAGVVGLVAGIAAKSVFSNLLAGLHIALAQPIRLDDVLIVEGEWGRVEEITATYVVLRIWDERRLIIPLSWFMEHPFQNWTRTSAQILGTVMLWLDFSLPVEAIRQEAMRLCRASSHWDGRVCVVQVTDTSDRAMQVRILVSSSGSGPNFDLRCELREALIAFVQREHPQALPRLRAGLEEPGPTKRSHALEPEAPQIAITPRPSPAA
ncbi:mechanosensitive ion channel domain-containing protein [Ideonella sp. DXS29W]|uniref:Mechanosensitive ion channel domain-containing protein n=1 Tax=Ideonella lacteola TaxID=2984193 RepID=A0ABU9BIP9_9BURK